MATNQTNLALERPKQPDEFLALIEKVIENPNVDAEKLKVIVELKLQLEDRAAEKAFDAAMQEAQKEVKALRWDKLNPEKNSRHVSYPKIDEMLQPIREKFGFSESFGVEPTLPAPNLMMMYSDVTHKDKNGSHRRRFHLPMSISGEGPKGGGVMTAAQAVGNGSSYGMRYLEKLIWKIPMLVDKDDNDGNPPQGSTVTEAQVKELRKLFDRLSEPRQKKALEHFKLDIPDKEPLHTALVNLSTRGYNNALKALAGALRSDNTVTIDENQEATLTALIDSIGGTCKADFLKTNRIKKVSELPSSQYQGALAALEQQRRTQ